MTDYWSDPARCIVLEPYRILGKPVEYIEFFSCLCQFMIVIQRIQRFLFPGDGVPVYDGRFRQPQCCKHNSTDVDLDYFIWGVSYAAGQRDVEICKEDRYQGWHINADP